MVSGEHRALKTSWERLSVLLKTITPPFTFQNSESLQMVDLKENTGNKVNRESEALCSMRQPFTAQKIVFFSTTTTWLLEKLPVTKLQ